MPFWPPWSPPSIADGEPPPPATPASVATLLPALAQPPSTGWPVEHPAEILHDPDFPDRTVLAMDDTRPEGAAFALWIPDRGLRGAAVRVGLRARTAPAADSTVVFRFAYRCPYRVTAWLDLRLGQVVVGAGVSGWIEALFTLSPATFDVPAGTHGVALLWRDPTDAADDLVGDVLVAAAGVELYA